MIQRDHYRTAFWAVISALLTFGFIARNLHESDRAAYCSCVKAGIQANSTCAYYTKFPDTPEVCTTAK